VTRQLGCTRALHDALATDPKAFVRLELIGYQQVEADDIGPADVLELRNCACGSTLAVSIGAPLRARLAQARRADEMAMIDWCRQALAGDAQAIAVVQGRCAFEALLSGGVR
jgi:hypothetical protein